MTEGMMAGDQLAGFCTIARVCAEAFVNVPDQAVVGNVKAVAEALGDRRFAGFAAGEELEQRYYDRLFVTSSPAYVPLYEDCVRRAADDEGTVRYAALNGPSFDHVLRCYRAVGFDYRLIEGFDLAVKQLKPDSLASELAFMAWLGGQAVELEHADPAAAARACQLLSQFCREHAGLWFGKAADCLAAYDRDFYAAVCELAAEAADALRA